MKRRPRLEWLDSTPPEACDPPADPTIAPEDTINDSAEKPPTFIGAHGTEHTISWLAAVEDALAEPGVYGPDVQRAVDDFMERGAQATTPEFRQRLTSAITKALAERRAHLGSSPHEAGQ